MLKNRIAHNPLGTLLLLLALMLAPMLACGSETTPEKVGEVGEATTAPEAANDNAVAVEPTASTEVDNETESAEPAAEPTNEPAAVPTPSSFAVGDVIEMGDLTMVVLGWSTPAGDEFTQPESGNRFVVVDLLLVNTGSAADSVSSLLQMELKDGDNRSYDIDIFAPGASSPEGEIAPGERIRGSVGFQTPAEATGLQFVFDASLFGSGRVFVDLGDEPVAVDPPAALAGEVAAEAFAVGDVIEIGDLALTVHGVTFPAGDEFNRPDEGQRFVVVDVAVENRTATAQNISSLLQMELKDATGQVYDLDLMAQAASGGTSPDGELAPGETLRGQVGFQVPSDATGLVFVFDGDIFGAGKVFVALPAE
jgi:hypothetical protein